MVQRANQPLSFLSGFVQNRTIGRVVATVDALVEQGSLSSWLMKWTAADGKWAHFIVDWEATRMWVFDRPDVQVFATGPRGKVVILTPKGSQQEAIDDSPNGPIARGPIRDLRGIGGRLYACGMSRQVYRREGPNSWIRRDQGAVLPLPQKGTRPKPVIVGFNSIDGVTEEDMYAVGFGGEIWNCRRNVWSAVESPTNVILHRVRVITDELAFAAGQKGVLLRRRADHWEQITHDATDDDFWGMEWFQNTLYVATANAIYRLGKNDSLAPVDMGIFETCGHLHANDGVMWSFGIKHLAYTDDGAKWIDVTP